MIEAPKEPAILDHYFISTTAKKIIEESDLPVLTIIADPELN